MTRPVGPVEWEIGNLPGARQAVGGEIVGGIGGVEFTLGASDTGTVDIQLLDHAGEALALPGYLVAYLSDDADGVDVTSAEPSGGIAVGTDGWMFELPSSSFMFLFAEDDGHLDLLLTEAGAATWYLVVLLPNGTKVVSGAIVFTA